MSESAVLKILHLQYLLCSFKVFFTKFGPKCDSRWIQDGGLEEFWVHFSSFSYKVTFLQCFHSVGCTPSNRQWWLSIAGLYNLFDQRAKCTNFKLVGGQTSEMPKAQISRCRRRRGGKVMGRSVPLPSRLGGLGSVVSSPSGVRGRALAENKFWAYFRAWKTHLIDTNLSFLAFVQHIFATNKAR